jgi:tetratricopeptide (TPR) repeat protein
MLWDVDSGQLLASLKGHTDSISCLAFFPDGKTLATASGDMTVRLWDVATGQERITLKGHKAGISSIAITPDGKLLATASGDGTIKLWAAATDKEATAPKTDLDPEDPDSPVAHGNRGLNMVNAGRLKEAEAAFQRAQSRLEKLTAAFPDSRDYRQELARTHINLAQIYERQKQSEKAVAELSIAAQMTSEDHLARHSLGRAYLDLGQWDEALVHLSKAIDLYASESAWWDRAQAYAALGQWDKALADFSKAIYWEDPNAMMDRLVRYVQLAEQNGKLSPLEREAALQAYLTFIAKLAEECCKRFPNDVARHAQMNWFLGVAYYRAGNWNAALKELQKAMLIRGGGDCQDSFFLGDDPLATRTLG